VGSFIGPGEMTTINLPHPAAKLSALDGSILPVAGLGYIKVFDSLEL